MLAVAGQTIGPWVLKKSLEYFEIPRATSDTSAITKLG